MKHFKQLLSLAALAVASVGAAHAQSAGSWLVRGGVTHIAPQVSSGCLSAPDFGNGPGGCTRSDVTGNTQLSGGVTYMYSDSLAVDVPLALPFKHKIIGAGSVSGVGQLGEVSALPATVFLQYRFNEANAKVRPYIGLGLTYAHFFGETGSGKLTALTNPGGSPTRFSVQSKWRLTPQIGAIVNLDSKWFIDMHVSKTNLSTTTTFSTGQHMNMALDPVTYGIEFGVKF